MSPDRKAQLLKGVLDMCLLAVIAEEPTYGYEMAAKLRERGLALVGEGSIYPLLARLERQSLVEGYRVASSEGPRRKYYRLAPRGSDQLASWIAEWRELQSGVETVLKGGPDG